MIQQAHDPVRVLLVADAGDVAASAVQSLQAAFRCDVLRVEDRKTFVRELAEFAPDAIVSCRSAGRFGSPAALGVAQFHRPQCPFILLQETVDQAAVRCLKSGAAAYVHVGEVAQLPEAVLAAIRDRAPLRALTDRQREVLHRLARGYSTRDIARRLGLSIKTIETHRMHVMKRLRFPHFAALVRYAVRTGMVAPDRSR